MSVPETVERFERLLRTGEDEPVFAEPWQAQAFALTVHLHAKGAFSWSDWATALSEELKAAAARGEPDDGTHYYEHWLSALERLVRERGLSDQLALDLRKEEWADAYRHTPHGKPIELKRRGAQNSSTSDP